MPELPDPEAASRWTAKRSLLEVAVATAGIDPHDVAMEALLCLGQAVWETTTRIERAAWLKLLDAEIDAGVTGEIDEDALREKRLLLSSRVLARSSRRLWRYAGTAFSSCLAEYVHALWHDVTVRTGPEHLPTKWLARRLRLFAGWFPTGRGRGRRIIVESALNMPYNSI